MSLDGALMAYMMVKKIDLFQNTNEAVRIFDLENEIKDVEDLNESSMMNLPMYSLQILDLEIEVNGLRNRMKSGRQGTLPTCVCVQELALLGPAICLQYNHDLDGNLPANVSTCICLNILSGCD